MEILIIAVVAIFILARLYSVLGRNDSPPPMTGDKSPATMLPDPEPIAEAVAPKIDTTPFPGRDAVLAAMPGFNPGEFLQGANAAYEMIVAAFAKGDRDALRDLLDDEVFDNYDEAISKREMEKKILSIDIVRMEDPKIIEGEVDGGQARIIVEFHSDLAIAEYLDGDDETVPDTSTAPAETTEQWTFARDVRSSDPNWKLVAVAAVA